MGVEVAVRAFARKLRHVSTACMTLGELVHSRLGNGWETPTRRISVHHSSHPPLNSSTTQATDQAHFVALERWLAEISEERNPRSDQGNEKAMNSKSQSIWIRQKRQYRPVTWPFSTPSTTGMNGWEEVMDECKEPV